MRCLDIRPVLVGSLQVALLHFDLQLGSIRTLGGGSGLGAPLL